MSTYGWVFVLFAIIGAVTELNIIWNFSSTMNCLMAAPNLVALLCLSGTVARETTAYFSARGEPQKAKPRAEE